LVALFVVLYSIGLEHGDTLALVPSLDLKSHPFMHNSSFVYSLGYSMLVFLQYNKSYLYKNKK